MQNITAVSTGMKTADLARENARWIKNANRYYERMLQRKPNTKFADFIVWVYALTWFTIDCKYYSQMEFVISGKWFSLPNIWQWNWKLVLTPWFRRTSVLYTRRTLLHQCYRWKKGIRELGCRMIVQNGILQTPGEFIIPKINFNCNN